MADQNQPDVEAIRGRLDATSPGMTVDVHDGDSTLRATANTINRPGFVGSIGDLVETFTGGDLGPVTATFSDDEDGQDATFALNAANDIRSLLDENARLNAELESLRAHNGVLVTEIYHQAARAEAFREERDALVVQHQADLAARRTAEEHLRRDVVEIDEEREALAAKLEATAETWRPAETAWFATIRDEKDIALAKEHRKLMRQALGVAPEMPRPPAEEGTVPTPSIHAQSDEQAADDSTEGATE